VATILFVDTVGMSCWRISILQQSKVILSINAGFVKTTIKLDAHRNATFFNAKGRISLCLEMLSWLNPFPNDTSLEIPYRPVPEQNLAE